MIEQIVKQIIQKQPELAGLDDVVEKEVLHHELLLVLEKEGLLSRLTFMGGTSLRMCFGSNRLSEDLDFTGGEQFTPNTFSGLGDHLKNHLENKFGLNVQVSEPKLTEKDTSTWKVTLEKFPDRKDLPSQKMHIDVCKYNSYDRIFRPAVNHYEFYSPIAALPLPVQSLREILADKMIAFAYRARRIKPRDAWDLAWLDQQQVEIAHELVQKKLKARSKIKDEFIGLIKAHSEKLTNDPEVRKDFDAEMSRFLPKEIKSRTLDNEHFWPYLCQTVTQQCNELTNRLSGNFAPDTPKM